MKCDDARKTLPLFLYGELSFEDEEQLEVHVDECDACRDALAREKLLFKSLDAAEIVPSAELLADCRAQLRQRLEHATPERASFWDKIRQGFTINFHFAPGIMQPIGALAMLAIGFFGARVTPASFLASFHSAGDHVGGSEDVSLTINHETRSELRCLR